MSTTLNQIHAWLKQQGMQTVLHPQSPESPRPRLSVLLGVDYRDRPIEVVLEDVDVNGDLTGSAGEGGDDLRFLQLISVLPFTVDEAHVADVMRFVMVLNANVELPGFGYDETTRLVFFRHVAVYGETIAPSLVENVLLMVLFLTEVFCKALEDLATGSRSLEQVLQDGANATL